MLGKDQGVPGRSDWEYTILTDGISQTGVQRKVPEGQAGGSQWGKMEKNGENCQS